MSLLAKLKQNAQASFEQATEVEDIKKHQETLDLIKEAEASELAMKENHNQLKEDYIKLVKSSVVSTKPLNDDGQVAKTRSQILKEKGLDIKVRGEEDA